MENKMPEIENFIDAVLDQDFSQAGPMFNDLIGAKVNDALEQEKIAVADQTFNGVEPEQLEMDFDEDEISDEDMDNAIDEVEADEDFEEIQDMNQDGKIEAAMDAHEEPEE